METITEWQPTGAIKTGTLERPSEEFVRAVADFLETDADDMLAELGYVYREAVVRQPKLSKR